MKNLLAVLFFCLVLPAQAENLDQTDQTAPEHIGVIPIEYLSTVPGDFLFEEMAKISFFANINEDYEGSPLLLFISFFNKNQSDTNPASLTSAILAGGTLGIIPMVTDNDVTIRYELMLHGRMIVRHDFTENFTEVQNIWDADVTELSDGVKTWVMSTTKEFKTQIESNEDLWALQDEYVYYFR